MEKKHAITFADLGLSKNTLSILSKEGFQHPFPIQAQAIPVVLEGKDVIGLAQTGTGKTLAFALPAIENIDLTRAVPQVLVMCPTRELAQQVEGEFRRITAGSNMVRTAVIYGGQQIERQFDRLRQGVHVVVGTPGRLLDHLNRKTLQLKAVTLVVMDEADEMLKMGFRDDIEAILAHTPKKKQTLLFSATMSQEIMEITKRYQKDPVIVKTQQDKQENALLIEQLACFVKPREKLMAVTRLMLAHSLTKVIIFCNTKRKVDDVVYALRKEKISVDGLHGDMTQPRRTKVLQNFKTGGINVLVATDVAGRGIDVSDVEMVINYELPIETEAYVHRIGRTGRAGKNGKAVCLIASQTEMRLLKRIERFTRHTMRGIEMPSDEQIAEMNAEKLIASIGQTLSNAPQIREARKTIARLTKEHDINDLAAALLAMMTNHAY